MEDVSECSGRDRGEYSCADPTGLRGNDGERTDEHWLERMTGRLRCLTAVWRELIFGWYPHPGRAVFGSGGMDLR